MLAQATSIARPNLISLGTCMGKFSKSGKFKLGVTCLDWLAKYAKYKVGVKRVTCSGNTSELLATYRSHRGCRDAGRETSEGASSGQWRVMRQETRSEAHWP